MMSKIDRYEVYASYDAKCYTDVHSKQESDGIWCKYEDVKELVERMESKIDALEMQSYSRNNHKCIGNIPYQRKLYMKDTFEEVYNKIGTSLDNLAYWNIDGIVDMADGVPKEDITFECYYVDCTDTKTNSGYIYLPYNNKYIKVFFYE